MKGKTLNRSLSNYFFSKITIIGKCIDLGSKSGSSSYYEFLNNQSVILDFVDFYEESEGVLKIDLEKNFEINPNSYDSVICSFTIEHIYNYKSFLKNTYSILSDKGKLYMSSPFIHAHHNDPDDFNRFTVSKFNKELFSLGFSNVEFKYIGFGPFCTSFSIISTFLPTRFFKCLVFSCAYCLDKILVNIKPNSNYIKNYAISYFIIATK